MDRTTVKLGPLFAQPKVLRSRQWPRTRKAHLALQPYCAACGSKDPQFLQVHHIQPVHLFPALELEPTNLITLCEREGTGCHFIFGHLYSWHSWNKKVIDDCRWMLGKVVRRPPAAATDEPAA